MSIRLFSFILIAAAMLGCSRDPGPPGPPGPQGPPGINILGTTYEVLFDFLPEEGYEATFVFDPPIEPSDVVLAYMEWEIFDGEPIWRLLPQTVIFNDGLIDGILQYQFDFTVFDFRIFLEGNVDFELLGPEWTQNQLFRIVVVPSDFAARVNIENYESVEARLGITKETIIKVDTKEGVLNLKK